MKEDELEILKELNYPSALKKRKEKGCGAIIFAIILLLLYIGSVFIFLPGLLITQLIFGISLKLTNFWLWGIIISSGIFFIFIILTGSPGTAGGIYLSLCVVALFAIFVLSLIDSTFFKKLIYNTWYYEFAHPLRESLLLDIEKHKILKEPPIIGIVTAKNVNVRKGPGTENEIIKTLNKGNEVRILIIRNDWVLVRYDSNYEGWIHKSLLTYKDSLKTDIKNSKEK